MSQHDMNIANGSGSAVRADINLALVALASNNSGSSAPATTYAYMWWPDTTNGVLRRRNAANSAWIDVETIDETFVLSRSSDTVLDRSDRGKTIRATGSYTQTFDAVATLADGWWVGFRVESGATLTLDPNSTEQIDGASTLAIVGPASGFIVCNGAALYTVGYASTTAATQAQQEAASSTTVFVTPGRQQFHPSAAKAWACWNGTGTLSVLASYNVTSVTDGGTGLYTPNVTTAFSSANHAPQFTIHDNGGGAGTPFSHVVSVVPGTGTGGRVSVYDIGGTLRDSAFVTYCDFGDQ